MKVEVHNSLSEIDENNWNAIVGRNRLICRYEYASAVEASRINDCRFFYPVVSDRQGIAAHACLYTISTELDTFAQGYFRSVTTLIRRFCPRFLVMRSLECGSPVALGSTICMRGDTEPDKILPLIINETQALARNLGAKVVLFRDFVRGEEKVPRALRQAGYRPVSNLPGTLMSVPWRSFGEYVTSLRSEYRNKLLARKKRFDDRATSLEIIRDFSPHSRDLARLWLNVYERAHEYKREFLEEDFFRHVDVELGRNSAIILARTGRRPVGFSLLLFDDDVLIPLFCGLDYDYNRDLCVYFNLLYKVIEVAIAERKSEIDFGITTLSPKIELGARIVPLDMYMKHLNPACNRVVPWAFSLMSPREEIMTRRVFREA